MKKIYLLLALPLFLTACQGKGGEEATATDSTSQVVAAKDSLATDTPATPSALPTDAMGDDLLAAIVAAHPNAPIVIDIWATWCGPCTRAIETMKAIKPQLHEKGAVVVYLADESSPEGDWKARIADIEGVHYRITSAQMNSLGIVGFPSFMVLNKAGKPVFDNRSTAGFPGNEEILAAVEK